MKGKLSIAVGALSAALLVGCTAAPESSSAPISSEETSSVSSSEDVSSSESSSSLDPHISRAEMIAQLGKAYYHILSAEELALDIDATRLAYSQATYPVTDGVRGEATSSWNLDADGVDASLDVSGLQSELGAEAKAALTLSVTDLNLKYEGINIEALTGTAAVYLSDKKVYVDASDENVGAVLQNITGFPGGKYDMTTIMSAMLGVTVEEYLHYLPETFGHDVFGGTLDEAGTGFVDFLTEKIAGVYGLGDILDGALEYLKNEDGTYKIIADVPTMDDVASIYAKAAGIDAAMAKSMIETMFPDLEFGGLSVAVNLDAASKLTSLELKAKISGLQTAKSESFDEAGNATLIGETISDVDIDAKIGVRYEDAVVVNIPDLSEYVSPF